MSCKTANKSLIKVIISHSDNNSELVKSIYTELKVSDDVKKVIESSRNDNLKVKFLKGIIYDLYNVKYETLPQSNEKFSTNSKKDKLEVLGLTDTFFIDSNWGSPINKLNEDEKTIRVTQLVVKKVARTERVYPSGYVIKSRVEEPVKKYIIDAHFAMKVQSEEETYFRGKTFLGEIDNILRFYLNFHYNPQQIELIIGRIKDEFNKAEIPFELKFYRDIACFNRADVCIIYIKYNYYPTAFFILGLIYNKYKADFREELPLFVKKLDSGIGFAESPQNPSISFGEKRAYLIAEGFLTSLGTENEINGILEFIKTKNYNIDEFYKNPLSSLKYSETFFKDGVKHSIDTFGDIINTPKSIFHFFRRFNTSKYYKKSYIDAACKIATMLCNEAIWTDEKNCNWISGFTDAENNELVKYKIIDNSFENGNLGIALFLIRVYFYVDNFSFAKTGLGAINLLINKIIEKNLQATNATESYFQKFALLQILRILKNRNENDNSNIEKAFNIIENFISTAGGLPIARKDDIDERKPEDTNAKLENIQIDYYKNILRKTVFKTTSLEETINLIKEFKESNNLTIRPIFEELSDTDFSDGEMLALIINSGRSFTNVQSKTQSDIFCPDITNGYAAIGHFFLRLYDPLRIWRIPKYVPQ